MQRMRRTQIYLEPDLSEALERLARKRGTSKAQLIRLATRRLLEQEQDSDDDPILGLIGIGHAGPGWGSEDHDAILIEHSLTAS